MMAHRAAAVASIRQTETGGRGVRHWWLQRISALVLIPTMLWFTASLIAHAADDHTHLSAWLARPFTSMVMVVLVVSLFVHMALGLHVIVDDYVHRDGVRRALLSFIYAGSTGLAAAGCIAAVQIAVG